MRLTEKLEMYRTARELFPLCVKCGRDLREDRLVSLRVSADRPNRFMCHTCPDEETPNVG